MTSGSAYSHLDPARLSSMSVTVTPVTSDPYRIKIVRNDASTIYQSGNLTGTQTVTKGLTSLTITERIRCTFSRRSQL
jgi:hypothetical protein